MKKIISFLLVLCVLAITACSAKNKTNDIQNQNSKRIEYADTVVYGTIWTAEDENEGLAEAFAVKDGKYIYVGKKDGVKQYINEEKTEIIDRTNQGLIIPGCTEGHSHYIDSTGLYTQLDGCNCSYEELLEIIKEQVETKNIKQFVSFGWETVELTDRKKSGYNFAKEIEKVAPNIPVVLIDNSGHSAVCNITALKNAGILDNPTVRGGKVELDINGEPSGYVGDQVVFYVTDKVIKRPLSDEQYKNACLYGMNTLLESGYTNVLDAFLNMLDPTGLYDALKQLDDNGELKINVAGCYNIKSYDADVYKDRVDEVVDLVKKYSSPHFDPSYIKLFADGVVESGTGWIFGEYKNVPEGKEHGNIVWSQDELNSIVEYANNKDVLVHTHSYGDAACNAVLNAYIASNKANGKEYRNSLGHARNIRNEDIIRASENKIPIAENLIWHTDYNDNDEVGKKIKDYIIGNIGEELYYDGYPMKSLIDNGVIMTSSTDAPAAMDVDGTIMNVLEVAVTGIIPHTSNNPFNADELITIREGLKALTIDGAKQLGLEKERGSIKVGKYADFVVLDKNILDYKEEQYRTIGDTKILNTYFEGKNVYSNKVNDKIDTNGLQ